MRDKFCGNCYCFREIKNAPNNAGSCHRHPPTVLVNQLVSGTTQDERGNIVQIFRGVVDSFFAPTRSDLYCFDWLPVPEILAALPGEVTTSEEKSPVAVAGLAAVTTH